ncbi:hypothetical protein ACHAXT_003171 [Thalassiosira profunda]
MARAAVLLSAVSLAAAFVPPRPPSVLPAEGATPFFAISPPTAATAGAAGKATSEATANVNFGDWIADAPEEITQWRRCPVEGTIPSYVEGTLIRNGGGIWSAEDESFSHIFDGFAKIHAYRVHASSVEHQARFLEGKWYNKFLSLGRQTLPAQIGTGPILDAEERPKTGFWRTLRAIFNAATIFDNTPVNIWDWTPNAKDSSEKRVTAITDAPPRTTIDFDTMETLSSSTMNPFAKSAKGYELLITAHPVYSQSKQPASASSVDTYNVAIELGLNGPSINLVKENSEGERTSENYAMIVLMPLRLDISPAKLVELGFLRAMEHVDYSRIVLIELETGDVVLDESIDEKVYFYHTVSQAEIGEEVSLRLCAYDTPDQLTGEHQFLRLEQARKGREWRNKLHKGGKFCDIVCNLKQQSVRLELNNEITQGFELPITRYSRTSDGDVPRANNQQSQGGADGPAKPLVSSLRGLLIADT